MFEVLHRFNYLFKRVFIHLIFHFFFSFDNLSSFIQTFFFLLSFFSFFFYIRYFLLLLLSVILKLVFIFIFVFFFNFGVRSNGLVDCHETGAPAKRSRLFSHLLCAPGDDAAKSKSGDCVNCGPGRPDNRPKRK